MWLNACSFFLYAHTPRLANLGHHVGFRMIDVLCLREKTAKRETRIVSTLWFIQKTVWKVSTSNNYLVKLVSFSLVSRPSCACEKEGLVFWVTFLVTAPRSENSNQIAERIIICNDVGTRAQDLVCMQCMGNAIITFFMPPHVTRKVVQNTRPFLHFREGLK